MSVLRLFVATPWLALLPAAAFGLLAARRRRASSWIAATAWLVYAAYEAAMARRLLCSGECNIRVDLLLLHPALLLTSVVAAGLALRRRRREA